MSGGSRVGGGGGQVWSWKKRWWKQEVGKEAGGGKVEGGLGVFDRGFDPGFIYLSLGQGGVLGQE